VRGIIVGSFRCQRWRAKGWGPSGGGAADAGTWDLVESRWGLGSVVVLRAGAAFAVLGVVAAGRTGIDDTWHWPVRPWPACPRNVQSLDNGALTNLFAKRAVLRARGIEPPSFDSRPTTDPVRRY
jgi:hypothetical protein